jgi:hypothetical protein
LKKAFLADERNFSARLLRSARGNVRDHSSHTKTTTDQIPLPKGASHASQRRRSYPNRSTTQEIVMTFTAEHLSPIVALIAGILILILPSLLNYVVAIYLIVTGLIGLNGIYHFIN